MKFELVEMIAVSPVLGSFPCPDELRDFYSTRRFRNAEGIEIVRDEPRKRFGGSPDIERRAYGHEIQAAIDGRLPENVEALGEIPETAYFDDGSTRTLMIRLRAIPFHVPSDMADSLERRGLAKRVEQ